MDRNVDVMEISDGKRYSLKDMVKADCGDCRGCSDCCREMGESIVLDPLDIHRLTTNLDCLFQDLVDKYIELHLVDGVILPNLKMARETQACPFLNQQGRCRIHSFRPGICRLFPLGRLYENRSFQYILQVHECKKQNRTKVKVQKWIDTPNPKSYERFVNRWHYFLRDIQKHLSPEENMEYVKQIELYILQEFYIKPYVRDQDFYLQVEERIKKAEKLMGMTKPAS